MSEPALNPMATRSTFWAVAAFYVLIAFEFFYMATPFAVYFYSVYGPGLHFLSGNPALSWLGAVFLPHVVLETSSPLINVHTEAGAILFLLGLLAFAVGAVQVYYHKLARKGAVVGGIYNLIRHPQYASLALSSFGLLLMWPRYIALLLFVTMLFAYYFLARLEENECERKFGLAYAAYKSRTNMFLPFRFPFATSWKMLPSSGVARVLTVIVLWALSCSAAVLVANGIRGWTLNSLYALYTNNSANISVAQLDRDRLTEIVSLAASDADVKAQLGLTDDAKYVNYIMPTEWQVPEIPMNPVGTNHDHHYPANYDRNLYKIVFTRALTENGYSAAGRDILSHTIQRVPLGEARVDLSRKKVIAIKGPPPSTTYGSIPMPIY